MSDDWRVAFASVEAVVVLAFVAAGVFALQATSRLRCWRYPDDASRIAARAGMDVEQAQLDRATELLVAYGQNDVYVTWKIRRATLAAQSFRLAVGALVALAIMFVVYVTVS